MIDNLFLLAIGAFGWGLSLTTYRLFAHQNKWPMGSLHADLPAIPVLLGIFALTMGLLFAAARGADYGGWIIIASGILLAIFWTGFLRVGSQVSLFLAPLAAALLLVGWLPSILGYEQPRWAHSRPSDLIKRTPQQALPAEPER